MQEREMENIFRDKLNNFEPAHNDRWSQIAAALPPEEKKRRFLWLWFVGAGVIVAAGIAVLLPGKESSLVMNKQAVIENIKTIPSTPQEEEKLKEQLLAKEQINTEKGDEITSELKTSSSNNHPTSSTKTTDYINPVNPTVPALQNKEGSIEPVKNKEQVLVKETPEGVNEHGPEELHFLPPSEEFTSAFTQKKTEPTVPPVQVAGEKEKPASEPHKKAEEEKEDSKWSFGIGGGVYATKFVQRMPADPGNGSTVSADEINSNKMLREQIFKGGLTFTENLWVTYQAKPWLGFRTGIGMMQTTQNVSFDVDSSFDRLKAPIDFNEGGTFSGNDDYLFPDNEILPGDRFSAKSRYFTREIPFSIILSKKLGSKWSLCFEGGFSYRWISSALVYMPDIDNVGMLYLKDKAAYPGLKNTWNLHAGLGIQYQLNDNFILDIFPRVSYSLQSNIRFSHYVQQYQRNWGVEFRISRKLGF